MAKGFHLKGLDKLLNHMQNAARLEEVKEVVKLNTSELERNMVRDAAVQYKGHTDSSGNFVRPTGATKRSIPLQTEYTDDGMSGRVSAGTHYFPYLELGTRYMTARPILRPNFYKQSMKFINDINRVMK